MSEQPPVIPATLADLVWRARALVGAGERRVLGIVGAPGAGKSTVCAALEEQLGDGAVIVGMDGFHLDNPVLEARGRRQAKGAPDTFDVPGYVSLLRRLAAAEEPVTYAPRFDREIETSVGSAVPVVNTIPLVVTEGLYLLHDDGGWEQVRPLLDEVWYLEVPTEERQRRLIGRRIGHGDSVADATDWVLRVDQANADVVEASKRHADHIFQLS
ncbi:MAG: nucleoside/nucleotide kinase family protein [Tessaracoccus sp.]|uniref:nucleoside/nucleotide kinase family protein n=1 Tax=Tessaracoccus sp. TaxID=1971211 RepID=UPI001EC370C5|nr:nucleoside/nucleotide kinase family protein [Tessaracoccus sp.]MBK7822309.1 nucleoside/nucleotide kinase family protein [Tessaracoccus sp.]